MLQRARPRRVQVWPHLPRNPHAERARCARVPARKPAARKPRIPPDVARVVDDHRALGEAARRALHVSEKVAKKSVERAARDAQSVKRAAARKDPGR